MISTTLAVDALVSGDPAVGNTRKLLWDNKGGVERAKLTAAGGPAKSPASGRGERTGHPRDHDLRIDY